MYLPNKRATILFRDRYLHINTQINHQEATLTPDSRYHIDEPFSKIEGL